MDTGSIGDVLYGRAEASFNGRFIQEYDSDEIEFMYAVSADQMCVIAPAAERIPQWMAIFKCFHLYVWILLPIVICLCGAFWFLLKIWAQRKRQFTSETQHWTFYEVLVQSVMVFLGASIIMPMRSMERFFVGSCLMASIIIIGTFQVSQCQMHRLYLPHTRYSPVLVERDLCSLPSITWRTIRTCRRYTIWTALEWELSHRRSLYELYSVPSTMHRRCWNHWLRNFKYLMSTIPFNARPRNVTCAALNDIRIFIL